MNTKSNSSILLAVCHNPFTGYKAEFYSLDDFNLTCIDLKNFEIKPETYNVVPLIRPLNSVL